MTKIIYGTKGEEIKVDSEDYDKLIEFNWNCHNGYPRTYRRRKEEGNKLKSTTIHQLILNIPTGFVCDHINHNLLDNRKENLRICTIQQNSKNRTRSKTSKSTYLGVTYHKRAKRYQAQIRTNKKRIYLGCFKTEEAAARAYDEAAKLHHKEFANLNFKD